jgi:hypothetical protein
MEITRTTVSIVAAACVTAGAAGGYLLSRGESPVQADERSAFLVSPDPAAVPVEQSEAVVVETPEPARAPEQRPVRPVAARPVELEKAPAPAAPPTAPTIPPPVTEVVPIAPAPIEPQRPIEIEAPPTVASVPAPGPELEELVIGVNGVIGLQVESDVSSETARVEDDVVARVTRDVKVGDKVAIPSGSKVHGEVILVERGGRVREQARLGVRFTSIVLGDGTRLPIDTAPIYREGASPGRESAAKIGGGAIGGAIIGGILGGARGAAIGGSIGAGAGSAAVVAGGRNAATLPSGYLVTVRVQQPLTVTVER